jgi:hypothetical protein
MRWALRVAVLLAAVPWAGHAMTCPPCRWLHRIPTDHAIEPAWPVEPPGPVQTRARGG